MKQRPMRVHRTGPPVARMGGWQSIRAGMGLGDSLYLQAIARHLVRQGKKLQVASAWSDIFLPLGDSVKVVPFTRQGIDILAHYTTRKSMPETDQFQDCCLSAGIREPVELRLDWKITNERLVETVRERAAGLPIVLVQLPRNPMGRTDGFGAELLPRCDVIQRAINTLRGRALLVQVGAGEPLHRFEGIDLDLAGQTRVAELLDLGFIAKACLGYVSFILPLAESLGKPALLVWARAGLESRTVFVRQITPAKVIHRKDLAQAVIDDEPRERIEEAARALLQ